MRSHWKEVALGEFAKPVTRPVEVVIGQSYRTIGVKWWGEGAYERETIDGSQTAAKTLSLVREGDLIINKIWVRHGSTAIASPAVDGCAASGEFPTFSLDLSRAIPRWIHWQTETRTFWEKCASLSRGTSGKNRIKPELFLTIRVPLPSLPEQRRLVARIEVLAAKIHEARTLRAQAAEETDALVAAQLRTVFESSAKQYGTAQLGNLISEANYGTSEKCSRERDENAVPVLRIPNVVSEQINFRDLKFARLSAPNYERALLGDGDILVVRTNGSLDLVGRSAVVGNLPEPMAFASYMIRLRVDQRMALPVYVQRMLRHLRISGRLIDYARTTAGQYNVSLGRLRSAEIPVPPLPEQRRIVAYLDGLQEKTSALKALQAEISAELDALMPSILDKAFRGEL